MNSRIKDTLSESVEVSNLDSLIESISSIYNLTDTQVSNLKSKVSNLVLECLITELGSNPESQVPSDKFLVRNPEDFISESLLDAIDSCNEELDIVNSENESLLKIKRTSSGFTQEFSEAVPVSELSETSLIESWESADSRDLVNLLREISETIDISVL